MKLSSVRIDNISFRFDAEYFRKEWVVYSKLLKKNSVRLGEIVDIKFGTTPAGAVFYKTGIPFIRSQNFHDGFLDAKYVHITTSEHAKQISSKITKDDVLVASVGATIGDIGLCTIENANINQNTARLRINKDFYISSFVFIFLRSKFGQYQLGKYNTGNAQSYLNSENLSFITIPIFPLQFQQSIETLVKLSHEKLSYSQQLYKEAELILNTELGLIDFNPENDNISIVKLSDSLQKTGRLDAEYYQPKYNLMIDYIKTKTYAILGTIVNIKKSIEPGSDLYCDFGIEFIRVSNITKFGITKTDIYLPLNFLPETELKTLKPKKDTILLSKDGTVGIAYTVKHETECITSGALLHLSIKDAYINDILPEYLTLVLNSTFVQLQAEQDSGGSIIKHWKPSEIATALIPLLPITIQTTISDKIKHSFQLRQESTALLEQAKNSVEMMIEGGVVMM